MKTKQYALIFVVVAATFLFCPAVRGQTYFGSVLGSITDSSGGVLPGATVTLTNLGTDEKHSQQTDPAGFYQFLNLLPGSYRVEADQKGFRHFIRGPVVVQVDNAVRIDITMEVGAVSQTIEVTAASPLLEPVTSSIGQVVDQRTVAELPLNGKNPMSLVALVPGVVPQGFSQSSPAVVNYSAWGNFQISGAMANESEAVWDGVTLSTVSSNNISFVPSQDALQEFKVQTNDFSAEFGRTAGAVINLTTKSGTNKYHGSAYEFLRNKVIDSNSFFNNAGGIGVAPFTQNQFGGTFGGPLVIPHVYDGHDKTFIFFNYEGFRQRQGLSFLYTVPTAAERNGDFSQSYDAKGNLIPIYDPLTTRPDPSNPGHYLRDQFQCNSTLNVICAGRIDPVAKIMAQTNWPKPNLPGAPFTNINNFLTNASFANDEDQFTWRVDKVVSDKQRITARYSFFRIDSPGLDPFQNKTTTVDYGSPSTNKASNISFGDTYSAGATSVFDLRIGYTRFGFLRDPASGGQDLTQLGFPRNLNNQVTSRCLPPMQVQGITGQDAASCEPIFRHEDTYQIQANLTKISGRQTMKFGFDGRLYRDSDGQPNDPSGIFGFNNGFTALDPYTLQGGLGFASFMLGYPSSGSLNAALLLALQSFYRAFYFQDDFRATSRLTFNLGLRWDWPGDFTERHNNLSFFLPDAVSPLAQPTGLPLVGRLGVVASPGRSSRAVVNTYLRGWGPRFGFAYRLGNNTAIRGGYGLFQLPNNLGLAGIDDPINTSTTNMVTTIDGGKTPFSVLSNPFPTGIIHPPGHDGPFQQTFEGQGFNAFVNTNYPGYSQQWNLDVQRELPDGMLFDVAYVGSKATKIPVEQIVLDQLPDQYLSMGSALFNSVPNPFYGLITSGALAQPSTTQEQLLLPYPQYQGVTEFWPYGGKSVYHSMQMKVEKKFSKGSTFLASYAVGKLISDTDSVTAWLESSGGAWAAQDAYNRRAERSLSTYDVPQRFVLSYVMDLPVGRGKKFLANVTGLPGKLASGWAVNGITTFQSGFPIQMYALTATRPNNICQGSARLSGSATSRLNEWFKTSCFAQPAPFTYGNAGRVTNVRAQGVNNFDFSLFKNTYFGPEDKLAIQFRAEFFNLFNRVQFGYPGQTLGTPSFGVISSQTNDPRLIQFALKLIF